MMKRLTQQDLQSKRNLLLTSNLLIFSRPLELDLNRNELYIKP